MKNDLPNNITANKLEKVQESLKVPREEKKKTNCLCRERQTRNRKVYDNLWSYSSYEKIRTKVPKLNRKYRAFVGKKSQKNSYRSKRRREKPVCNQHLEELEVDHCL